MLIADTDTKGVTAYWSISVAKKKKKVEDKILFLIIGSSAGRDVTVAADELAEKTAEGTMMKQECVLGVVANDVLRKTQDEMNSWFII